MKLKLASVGVIIGGFFILGIDWSKGMELNNWRTGELVGANLFTIALACPGVYFIYYGVRKLIGR